MSNIIWSYVDSFAACIRNGLTQTWFEVGASNRRSHEINECEYIKLEIVQPEIIDVVDHPHVVVKYPQVDPTECCGTAGYG